MFVASWRRRERLAVRRQRRRNLEIRGGSGWRPRRSSSATPSSSGVNPAGVHPGVPGSGSGDIGPSDADIGALWLTVAFALPGVIAAIAAVRRQAGPLLITAGILCFGQAFIAFSGVALPFVVPAIYMIVLGFFCAHRTRP